MNTQEPHPKARPTLSEGQRRVLELLTNGPRWMYSNKRIASALAKQGLAEYCGQSYSYPIYRITPAGRAALADTDADADAQGNGGEDV